MNSNLLNLRQQRARARYFIAGLGMAAGRRLFPSPKRNWRSMTACWGCCCSVSPQAPCRYALYRRADCPFWLSHAAAAVRCRTGLDLPLLMLLNAPLPMAGALLLFGAINGLMDVSMNYQAVIVEREAGASKMSAFTAFTVLAALLAPAR